MPDIRAGVRRLFRLRPRGAARLRADADEELESFLQSRVEALVARGAEPDEARAEALRRLGGRSLDEVRERLYHSAARREGRARLRDAVQALRQDLHFALRHLARSPGFTLVATLTLALGIGASTAIFSAVNPILFAPLPYPHAERIVTVSDRADNGEPIAVTFGTYRELAARSRSFDTLAVMKPWQPTLIGANEPERLDGQRVSARYFRALGVRPAIGRDFDPSEDRPNGPRVVVLGDGLWRRRFGGDPHVVGGVVTLDDVPYIVVGVMPRAFENVLAPSAELWAPLQYGASFAPESREWGHHLDLVGRLRPGVGREEAARELAAIARTPVPEFPRVPWAKLDNGVAAASLQESVTRGVRPALLAVLGAVLLLLAIACVNVTNLLLARGAQRGGELALRAALGAGRGRLVRQLMTESLLLAALGGALGVAVAAAGVRALVALGPPGLPRLGAVRLDAAALAFAVGVTTLTGLVVGIAPASGALMPHGPSRRGLSAGLRQASRRTAGDHRRMRGALVVAEVALALVLLVSAGLLLRSLERLFAVDVGFDTAGLLTMQVQASGRRLESDSARTAFFDQALEAVRRVPGVAAAGFTSQLPLSGDLVDNYGVRLERDGTQGAGDELGAAIRYAVTPGYFEAMRIPLRRGRPLDRRDRAGAPRSALINESFARRRFPGRDPLGERLRFGSEEGDWYTVVGVVGDVRQASLGPIGADAVYITPGQWHWVDRLMSLVVRAGPGADPAALAPAVRRAVWSVDRDQPIVRVATMDALLAASAAERRFALTLFEAFAVAALALAAIGLYGVLAGSVAERTRELGVRAALGASRGAIVALVVRQGTALAAAGVFIGVAGAAAASRALASLLFGISPLDPATYLGVVALLAAVSAAACALPAWRAARVDPAITLRAE